MYDQNQPYQDVTLTLRATRAAQRSFSTVAFAIAAYSFLAQLLVTVVNIALLLTGIVSEAWILENEGVYSILLSDICMYGMALPVLYLIIRRVPTFPIEKQRISFAEIAAVFLVARLGEWAGAFISNFLTELIGLLRGRGVTDTLTSVIEDLPVWFLILSVVIIGPIIEEIIFRKWIIDRLGAYGDATAIVFSSVLFALSHGNFYQFAYTFFCGLAFGYLYTRTGKVIYPIALHMLSNFLGSVAILPLLDIEKRLLSYVEYTAEQMEALLASPEGARYLADTAILSSYSLLTMALAIGGAFVLFKYRRRVQLNPRLLSKVGASSMTRAAVYNMGMLCFMLVTVGIFALSLMV